MPKFRWIDRLGVAAVCWAALASTPAAFAAEPTANTAAKPVAAKSGVSDVTLSKEGALTGVVVNAQGKRVDGAVVTIHQGTKQVARVVSDKNGAFQITEMRGGVYQIKAGDGSGTYRVWTANAAPPSSRTAAVVVSTPQVVRGQAGGAAGLAGIGLGAGGLIVGGVGLHQSNQNQDEIDDLQNQNGRLQAQLNQALASPP